MRCKLLIGVLVVPLPLLFLLHLLPMAKLVIFYVLYIFSGILSSVWTNDNSPVILTIAECNENGNCQESIIYGRLLFSPSLLPVSVAGLRLNCSFLWHCN